MNTEPIPQTAPTVSICIPAFNGAAHIRATIDSVLAQSFGDFELLVVDDLSTDATASIVQTYRNRDARVRLLVNTQNCGAEGNWNRCREQARGKYFKLLPQDDLLASDCLARQVAILECDTASRIALAFGARRIIGADGRLIMRRAHFGARPRMLAGRVVVRKCVRRGANLIGEPGNVLMRRALVERIGPFDASNPYVVDLDYWFRALQHGSAYYDPCATSSFRISGGQWSVAIGARQYNDFREFLSRYGRDPSYGIKPIDRTIGTAGAWVHAKLRILLYRWLLRSKGTT